MSDDKVEIREFDKTKSGQLWIKENGTDNFSFTLKSQSKILTALDQNILGIEGNLRAI